MKNKILIKASYTDDGNGYDDMYLDDKHIFSTSEFVECPEDSIYTRDAISSLKTR